MQALPDQLAAVSHSESCTRASASCARLPQALAHAHPDSTSPAPAGARRRANGCGSAIRSPTRIRDEHRQLICTESSLFFMARHRRQLVLLQKHYTWFHGSTSNTTSEAGCAATVCPSAHPSTHKPAQAGEPVLSFHLLATVRPPWLAISFRSFSFRLSPSPSRASRRGGGGAGGHGRRGDQVGGDVGGEQADALGRLLQR